MEYGKVKTREEIISCFHDGQSIAIGGQAGVVMPWNLIECIIESGAKDLTILSIDASEPNRGVGRLIREGRVSKMITTHMGTNPEASKAMLDGKIEVELCPMGSFMERLRCGAAGLGGVLTKTGLGTVVAEGKPIQVINGEEYLVESVLHPDVAITRCRRADNLGNLAHHGTGTASHAILAKCAKLSIVEADLLCDVGEIAPDDVRVAGIYVDMILGDLYQVMPPQPRF